MLDSVWAMISCLPLLLTISFCCCCLLCVPCCACVPGRSFKEIPQIISEFQAGKLKASKSG